MLLRPFTNSLTALAIATSVACGSHSPPATPSGANRGALVLKGCSLEGADGDRDGLADDCETTLVSAFAPVLVTAPDACRESSGPPGGGYFYGAQPIGERVRLVYLPAYFFDCCWSGVKCWLPGIDCGAHAGDSEFIALDVSRSGDGWIVDAVFLSAHCFGRSEGDCRWYRGRELDRFTWVGGAPVIWVSEGRHANYPSSAACDRGHFAVDTCDRNTARQRFPVVEGRNIGSEANPLVRAGASPGCVAGATVGSGAEVVRDAVECFWSEKPFRGWQGEGEGATPYVRYLEQVAGY